ncbi:hypothetical protein CROQUDRAFT_133745 [Cronartium quercuum f. sp. fusiforme G11]|uniref:Uncharacterized protein n=1 Tax=Cronartium quercuum f. sp. fusiforme G11 TaxID=708437 RepID=A0A9P6NGC4_9BASI|nr:hypothetical protein CROQUDRAFT_133745 [Cronartium quercuum f. sp. fusiforme G11]
MAIGCPAEIQMSFYNVGPVMFTFIRGIAVLQGGLGRPNAPLNFGCQLQVSEVQSPIGHWVHWPMTMGVRGDRLPASVVQALIWRIDKTSNQSSLGPIVTIGAPDDGRGPLYSGSRYEPNRSGVTNGACGLNGTPLPA